MKCIAEKEIKDCCNQETCCISCGYEDCHEGCDIFDRDNCSYAVMTVFDEIKTYNLNKLAIYLHSWQVENKNIEEIKTLMNEDLSTYK